MKGKTRKILKRFTILFGLILLAIIIYTFIFYPKLPPYLFAQAKGQYRIITNVEKIENILNSNQYSDSVKSRLKYIQTIKTYAEDHLAITKSENYTTYLTLEEPLMWVVTASKPYALEPVNWDFPFFGSFPYLGFFEEQMAIQEKEIWDKKGFDTNIRNPGGWSTLGWFTDPVFQSFLSYSDGDLSELVIHELTHGTVFVKDSVIFNENLASFIGYQGTLAFLKANQQPEALRAYIQKEENRKIMIKYIVDQANQLKSLYDSDQFLILNEVEKANKKEQFIVNFINNIKSLPLSKKERYYEHYLKLKNEGVLNNTFFLSYLRYQNYSGRLEKQFNQQFNGSIIEMLNYYED